MTAPQPLLTDLVARLRAAGCVFAEEEAELLVGAATGPAELEALVARRVAGEPLEVLLGWVDFAGVRVAVAPGVFVPRQRTAYVVELALPALQPGSVVVDLCCGSGALGLALASAVPGMEVHAADISPEAVACARGNLMPVGGHVHLGDLDAPLPPALRGNVAVIVANVPYVPSDAVALMPPESRDHEPLFTVDGGADGLDVLRRVALLAPGWLAPGGRLFVETSEGQAPVAADAFATAGLRAAVHQDEERGATVVEGRLL
jgi:release factor glutamine methyltransferase